jgi:hypothetical protein
LTHIKTDISRKNFSFHFAAAWGRFFVSGGRTGPLDWELRRRSKKSQSGFSSGHCALIVSAAMLALATTTAGAQESDQAHCFNIVSPVQGSGAPIF